MCLIIVVTMIIGRKAERWDIGDIEIEGFQEDFWLEEEPAFLSKSAFYPGISRRAIFSGRLSTIRHFAYLEDNNRSGIIRKTDVTPRFTTANS